MSEPVPTSLSCPSKLDATIVYSPAAIVSLMFLTTSSSELPLKNTSVSLYTPFVSMLLPIIILSPGTTDTLSFSPYTSPLTRASDAVTNGYSPGVIPRSDSASFTAIPPCR